MASSVGCSSLGPVWWDAGGLYHLIISEVIGAVSCGLLDSFIHSTFINILMGAYKSKSICTWFRGTLQAFPQRLPCLVLFCVWAVKQRMGVKANGWCQRMENERCGWRNGEHPAQPNPRFYFILFLLKLGTIYRLYHISDIYYKVPYSLISFI